jgi:hypothetical protein
MKDTLLVAAIAGLFALAVSFINSLVSESYKRFRDGSTLAASLIGELSAYEYAWPMILENLDTMIRGVENGNIDLNALRSYDRPKDLIYEKSIEKLGLLGPITAERVVYVYSNIHVFRISFEMILGENEKMTKNELLQRLQLCKDAVARAYTQSEVLIGVLRTRSSAKFFQNSLGHAN